MATGARSVACLRLAEPARVVCDGGRGRFTSRQRAAAGQGGVAGAVGSRLQHHPSPRRLGWTTPRGRTATTASSGDGDETAAAPMNPARAREVLGVADGAGGEELLRARAKKKKLAEEGESLDAKELDAAYDTLLMASLRNRQEGRGVPKGVRYADVKPVSQVANELLQKLPGNVQVSVGGGGSMGSRGRASDADLTFSERVGQAATAQNITFSLLSLWVLLQSLSTPMNFTQDSPGTQIAAALIASLYFQRQEKGLKLGRSVAFTMGGLLVGVVLGSVLEALLRVDIAPFLGIHSPGMVVGEFGILGVWFAIAFLW